MGIREDLSRVAGQGFWGKINDPVLVAQLGDPKVNIVTVGHQPLVGVYQAVHSKYLAPGLADVLVNFIAEVDAVGKERGGFGVEIPGIGKDRKIILKQRSPYDQKMPGDDDIFGAILPPTVEQTTIFFDRVVRDLSEAFPDQNKEIVQRAEILRVGFLEKGEFIENLSQWSTLLRQMIYKDCGIKVVEISELDLLRSSSAAIGLAHVLANYDGWFASHKEIYERLAEDFSENNMRDFFPGPRREARTSFGDGRELPFWVTSGKSRSRAVLVEKDGLISVVAGAAQFNLGEKNILKDEAALAGAITKSGLGEKWTWDVLTFTYLVRFCWGLPYISGRGGARYDVITEYIARRLNGIFVGEKLILGKKELTDFGYSPLWVGIPQGRNSRHRSLPAVYALATEHLAVMKREIDEAWINKGPDGPIVRKRRRKKLEGLENLKNEVNNVRTKEPSLLEMFLLGGQEAVLATLRSVEKYEARINSRRIALRDVKID